jgi:hypothetical protein
MNKPVKREGFVEDEPAKVEAPVIEGEAEPETTTEPAIVWPMRCKLMHRAIRNNKNEEIREVVFREPTGGDINRYGAPVKMNSDGLFDIDDRKMGMVMAALSGINLPFLERMDPRDWQSCAYRLKLFFHPSADGWL